MTGGGSGVGKAIALALAGAGVDVTICGRREAALRAAAGESEPHFHGIAADVTDEASMAALHEQAEAARGPFDIVVANAGMAGSAPAHRTTLADWQRTLDVNLTGAFLTVKPALAGMAKRGKRPDRLHRLDCRPEGLPLCRALCGGQARRRRPDAGAGRRNRQDRRHRQRGLPRLRRNRHAARNRSIASSRRPAAAPTRRAPASPRPIRRAASSSRTRWRRRCCGCAATGAASITGQAISISGGETW